MEGPIKGKTTTSGAFYLAPQRLSLQTPCEIIREARADVMGLREDRGLRPVPTSRPFTPKDRERVLFGATRRGTRPPSAVNLSYLHKGETGVVKLPTIPNKNKQRSTSTRLPARAVLSLDNLVEEVEVENLVTVRDLHDGRELPWLRKSYSSPQERVTSESPELPLSKILRDKWTSESSGLSGSISRQKVEPLVQKKKVLRLQSISLHDSYDNSITSAGNSPRSEANDSNQNKIELPEEIKESIQTPAEMQTEETPVESSSPKRQKSEDLGNNSLLIENVLVAENMDIKDSKEEVLIKEKETVKETTEVKEEDLVAVLSDGKLVWEAPNIKKQTKVEYNDDSPPKQKSVAAASAHLRNMRNNLQHVQGRMQELNEQIEQLGSRVSSGRRKQSMSNNEEVTFHMNNNKRYHVSTKKTEGTGKETNVKAYKKWSENVQIAEEEEVNNAAKESAPRYDSGAWDFFWKNSYFRSKEEALRPELEPLAVILEDLRVMHGQDADIVEVEKRLDTLYTTLKQEDGFAQGGVPTSFKSKLLQTLYMYADDDRPKLLLLIARLVLALRVESGLPAACKMVFKVARTDSNDHLFLNIPDILELFLDGIGRASPLDAAESCIYGYGALKFLTVNSMLLAQALHLGALDLVTLHLKMVNSAQQEGVKVGEQTQHAMFQLTGALRNIADGEGIGPLFLTTNCVPTLVKTMLLFRSDEEIVSNIARTLSSLSSDEDLVQVLLTVDDLAVTLVDLLKQYQHRDQILIRLSYTLGNVLACSDLARVQLSRTESCLPTLLSLLQIYLDKETSSIQDKEAIDDVVVKIIRVVANMSMNPLVGSHLSSLAAKEGQLGTLLRSLVAHPQESVLLAALGCLNNLSYYVEAKACLLELTHGVLGVLADKGTVASQDCAVEACRVLGNLTRHKPTRDLIFSEGGLETLEKVLVAKSLPGSGLVARSVCGVLVNMLLDQDTRQAFLCHQGIDKLVAVLNDYPGDWLLAGLVCRAIWNACAPDISVAVTQNNMDQLLTTLANCLEEENWVDGDPEWEEFAGIATDLLERFNAHIESSDN